MKNVFAYGDQKEFRKTVTDSDIAAFNGEVVHPVCSTFALARDVEWTTRQFAIDMCESGEEGIGTYLEIHHDAPARVGEEICIRGVVESLNGNKLICTFEVRAGERLVAHRSEEHTSELQSRENLVCRLLLEKKKELELTTSEAVAS